LPPHRTYIAVEGQHDVAFIDRLLHSLGFVIIQQFNNLDSYWHKVVPRDFPHGGDLLRRVPVPQFFRFSDDVSVAVHYGAGDSAISTAIKDTLTILPTPPSALGFILDADNVLLPAVRYERVRADLVGVAPFPIFAGSLAPGPPRCAGYVLPDNVAAGTLEDLLLECADREYPHTLALAQGLVAAIVPAQTEYRPNELQDFLKPCGRKKATVACIATVLRPGKAVQVSIKDNRWVTPATLALPRMAAVQDLVRRLVLP
jgi:hypothetical protein